MSWLWWWCQNQPDIVNNPIPTLKSRKKEVQWIQNTFSDQELLFLRLLSLAGFISLSLFRDFILLGGSRESDSWSSAVSVWSSVVAGSSASFSVLQQQGSGMGCASRVKVWVWNRGEQANRALMALCSSRLFFCSGGLSFEAANK